jgi:predicted DsbA family dithiol-disulfide isomerase
MRVEIWTDIICPWCGIGNRQLELALEQFEAADQVELVHRSFQLDERAREGVTEPVREMLQNKKGLPAAQVDAMTARVEGIAAELGLAPYIVGDNRSGNTSLAHELAAFATEQGRGKEMWDALFRAYFGEARSIFDVGALVALASEVGLDADQAREALTSRMYAAQVRAEGHEARTLGASGVPFIVIDRRYAIPGAQPAEAMLQALETAWKSRPAPLERLGTPDEACGPDGCAVPD